MNQLKGGPLSHIGLRGMILLIILILIRFTHSVSGEIVRSHFDYDGFRRNYILFLPQNVHANMSVILCLHALNQDANLFMNYTAMNSVADTAGFMAVYPEGISGDWTCGGIYGNPDIDDVGYISALIDTINAYYDIDMNRIYCCGFSRGAQMTYELVSQIGRRFAAVGGVASPINESTISYFKPFRPFPVILCYGKEDRQYGEITLDFWLNYNQCPLKADTVLFPDVDPADNCTVEKISFTNCSNETNILFYNVINGGHHWPGGTYGTWSDNLNKDINFGSEVWNFFNNYQNPISTGMAYGKTIDIYPVYIPSGGDTLKVKTQLVNPQNHPVMVRALIQGNESAYQDSIELFDDGLHGDGDATDGQWGNQKWMSELLEDMYTVDVITRDLTEGTVHYVPILSHFTTIGPVVFHSVSSRNADDVLEPGANIRLYITLKNIGKTAAATDIKAQLVCLEPSWLDISLDTWSYVDIAPGQTVRNSTSYKVNILDTYPGDAAIPMEVHISSNDQLFWNDTFSIPVYVGVKTEEEMEPEQFSLYPNYPNPFNPTTTIQYKIPKFSEVTLTIYDLLGREIATLVNKTQTPGEYSAIWNGQGHPSGIYFCRLNAGDFMETRKLVLQK